MCRLAWRSAKQLQTSGCGRASERLAKSWPDFARICAYMGASVLVSIGPTRCPPREGAAQLAALVSSLALIPHQLVERDRQIAHAFSGRMIDRIRHGRRGADDADFADAFDTERIDLVILLFDEDDVDRVHVRIHRHVIVGEIMAHEAPEPVIGDGLLMQRHADAADDGAENLAARELRVEDAAGRHRADHARDPDDAKLFIDLDLGEYRRMR